MASGVIEEDISYNRSSGRVTYAGHVRLHLLVLGMQKKAWCMLPCCP